MYHTIIFNLDNNHSRRNSGGHRIASFLREKGWDAEVIDWGDFFSQEELMEIARSRINNNTIFVGFSSFMCYWSEKFEQYCFWIKQRYPHVKIILGGQSSPRMVSEAIDYYVHGYGENAVLELVKSFVGNHEVKFDSLYGDRKVISAIHSYPAFPMKSLKISYENRDFIESKEWLTVEFARGCIFKCLYCNYPILGVKGDYTRDAEDFHDEIAENYDRFGVSNYMVADETFNDYSEKIQKYANVVDKLNFKPFFSGFLRADLLALRPQDWDPLLRLGMLGHFYGIESMNPPTMKAIGKGGNIEKVLSGLLEARKYFKTHDDGYYRGHISLIIGLPYETFETLEKTFSWILKNWSGDFCGAWPLEIPFDPKMDRLSRLSTEYKKWGYREDDNLNHTNAMINQVNNKLNWVNDNMSMMQASQISDQWLKIANQNQKMSCFNLYQPMYDNKSLKESLEIGANYDAEAIIFKKIFDERFEKYKYKKLSL